LVLQALYGSRSKGCCASSLAANVLYGWFVGLSMDEPAWNQRADDSEDSANARLSSISNESRI